MQLSLDAMQTALRVLNALAERQPPEQRDLDHLRDLAVPEERTLPYDELACAVIQRALKHRAEVRGAEQ